MLRVTENSVRSYSDLEGFVAERNVVSFFSSYAAMQVHHVREGPRRIADGRALKLVTNVSFLEIASSLGCGHCESGLQDC
jgi:hypothetical protein